MIAILLALAQVATPVPIVPANAGYPTEARADYVLGCMAANGQTRDTLQRCSCAIDAIASVLPYDDYVRAETVLGMRQTTGERASMFNETALLRGFVTRLREAQVEADFRCY